MANILENFIPGAIRQKMQSSKLDNTPQGKIIEQKTGLKPSAFGSVEKAYAALDAAIKIDKGELEAAVSTAEAPSKIAKAGVEEKKATIQDRMAELAVGYLESMSKGKTPSPSTPEQATSKLDKATQPTMQGAITTPPIVNTPPMTPADNPAPLPEQDTPLLANAMLPTGQQVYIDDTGTPKLTKTDLQIAEESKGKRNDGLAAIESKRIGDLVSAQKQAQGTYRFMQQFGRSWDELKKYDPEIDKEGFDGWARRKMSQVNMGFDGLPESKALEIQILPMANKMARDIEGGRVTDTDRTIYANAFAKAWEKPSATNTRNMSYAIINLLDQGGYEPNFLQKITGNLKQLAAVNHPMFNKVLEQVLTEYPDMVEQIYGKGAKINED